jgi:hypothetical protein
MDGIYNPEDLRAFLLHRLPEEASSLLEERLISDETFFREVLAAEDELIDECALGMLSPGEEQDFLLRVSQEPSLEERLAMRRAFFQALTSQPLRPAAKLSPLRRRVWPILVPGLALAASLLLVATLLLFQANRGLQRQLAQRANAVPAPQLHPSIPAPPSAAADVATLFFPTHAFRGADEQPSVHVSASPSRLLQLQLQLPAEASRWTVSIQNKQDAQLLQTDLDIQQTGNVTYGRAYIESSVLEPGLYRVLLSSRDAAHSAHRAEWTLAVSK